VLFGPDELLPYDGSAVFTPDFLDPASAVQMFSDIESTTPWESVELTVFGRKVNEPRLSAWMNTEGRPYVYSGTARIAHAFTPALESLRELVEQHSGHSFNSALVNLYRSGDDALGWHADDEPENGREPVIASVSFGAVRRFDLRHRETKETVKVDLTSGSLLLMSGATQHRWVHQVPRQRKVREPRINVTFRRLV
jgi:alkylated DNA repair dioxygenase AlkB